MINNAFDFPNKIPIISEKDELIWQEIAYEWKPTTCSNCTSFGHSETHCQFTKVWRPKASQHNLATEGIEMIIDEMGRQVCNLNKSEENSVLLDVWSRKICNDLTHSVNGNNLTLNRYSKADITRQKVMNVQSASRAATPNSNKNKTVQNLCFDMDLQIENTNDAENINELEGQLNIQPQSTINGSILITSLLTKKK